MAHEFVVRLEERRYVEANICDFCGKRDEAYPEQWWFPKPGWVTMKWGSDPAYSPEALMCDECAGKRHLLADFTNARRLRLAPQDPGGE